MGSGCSSSKFLREKAKATKEHLHSNAAQGSRSMGVRGGVVLIGFKTRKAYSNISQASTSTHGGICPSFRRSLCRRSKHQFFLFNPCSSRKFKYQSSGIYSLTAAEAMFIFEWRPASTGPKKALKGQKVLPRRAVRVGRLISARVTTRAGGG